jgi:hypothetical protein
MKVSFDGQARIGDCSEPSFSAGRMVFRMTNCEGDQERASDSLVISMVTTEVDQRTHSEEYPCVVKHEIEFELGRDLTGSLGSLH